MLHRGSRSRSTRPRCKAGKKAASDYIEEMAARARGVRRRPRGRGGRGGGPARGGATPARSSRGSSSGGWRDRGGDEAAERSGDARTRSPRPTPSSARRPARSSSASTGRSRSSASASTRPAEAARRGDEGTATSAGSSATRSPRSRPAPTCSTSTPASRSPTSRRSSPGPSSSSSRSSTCPLSIDSLDRRGARGRARRVPGQAAGELGDRRGGAPRARPAADPEVRRRGRRDLERRHRHLRGPRRAVRGREADRRARGGPRHPARGRHRRPARHADRGDGAPPASRCSGSSRRLREELGVNTTCGAIERQLRDARPRADQRRVPADGDRVAG